MPSPDHEHGSYIPDILRREKRRSSIGRESLAAVATRTGIYTPFIVSVDRQGTHTGLDLRARVQLDERLPRGSALAIDVESAVDGIVTDARPH
jgi:hypothetical protein